MKLKDLKHNHSLTDLLKVLIFSILMLLPFIAVGTRCLYVICNKNAYHSYYGETINDKIETSVNYSNLTINNEYYYTNAQLNNPINNLTVSTASILVDNVKGTFNNNSIDDLNINRLGFYNDGNNNTLNVYCYSDTTTYITSSSNVNINFIYKGVYSNTNGVLETLFNNNNFIYTITYNSNSYLDNVFEYSVNKLENSDLFTWTQNTAVYTGINAMTTSLQIQGTAIPMLITYWFLLTVIYIILDIVIKLFTVLTHLIGSKATEK